MTSVAHYAPIYLSVIHGNDRVDKCNLFFLYKRLVKRHICCCSSVRIGPLWRVTLVQRRSGFFAKYFIVV